MGSIIMGGKLDYKLGGDAFGVKVAEGGVRVVFALEFGVDVVRKDLPEFSGRVVGGGVERFKAVELERFVFE